MKTRTWILIFAVILAVCAAASFALLTPGEASTLAEITRQGSVIKTVDLRIDQTFTVESENGGYNVISIRDGKIVFLVARRKGRAVGMCSVASCFSTFACTDVGAFDDFYIEPAFRKKGIARLLASAAQTQCKEQGLASLTVTCAPCDEELYRALGFDVRLGSAFARIL